MRGRPITRRSATGCGGTARTSSSRARTARRSARSSRDPLPQPFRILVAEDDESFLDVISLLLEQDGRFAVAGTACNGREAVDLVERLTPDAVVMDIEMPVLDGVEATRLLRTARPGLPIVAVSGHDYEERVLEIRRAGADDSVRKARLSAELPRVLLALLAHRVKRAE